MNFLGQPFVDGTPVEQWMPNSTCDAGVFTTIESFVATYFFLKILSPVTKLPDDDANLHIGIYDNASPTVPNFLWEDGGAPGQYVAGHPAGWIRLKVASPYTFAAATSYHLALSNYYGDNFYAARAVGYAVDWIKGWCMSDYANHDPFDFFGSGYFPYQMFYSSYENFTISDFQSDLV